MSQADPIQTRAQKLLNNPEALCNMVRRIALEAGEIVLRYYDGIEDMGVELKADQSPVTIADQETEKFIRQKIEEITPGVPFIGEETVAAGGVQSLNGHEHFWLVDPIDGTKNFIAGGDEFTVNIALITSGVPVLGAIFAPEKGLLYAGFVGGEAIRWNEDTKQDKPIFVRRPPREGITVVSNRRPSSENKEGQFLEGFKIKKVLQKASSLKLCAIAEGKADLYPRFGPTCEWDTAAGDAILRAAGGMVTDTNGVGLQYGSGVLEDWLNPDFVASSFSIFDVED